MVSDSNTCLGDYCFYHGIREDKVILLFFHPFVVQQRALFLVVTSGWKVASRYCLWVISLGKGEVRIGGIPVFSDFLFPSCFHVSRQLDKLSPCVSCTTFLVHFPRQMSLVREVVTWLARDVFLPKNGEYHGVNIHSLLLSVPNELGRSVFVPGCFYPFCDCWLVVTVMSASR